MTNTPSMQVCCNHLPLTSPEKFTWTTTISIYNELHFPPSVVVVVDVVVVVVEYISPFVVDILQVVRFPDQVSELMSRRHPQKLLHLLAAIYYVFTQTDAKLLHPTKSFCCSGFFLYSAKWSDSWLFSLIWRWSASSESRVCFVTELGRSLSRIWQLGLGEELLISLQNAFIALQTGRTTFQKSTF